MLWLFLELNVKKYQMLEKRKEYIDQLLKDLRLLEERVSDAKDSDSLPFSFFSDSFYKIQEISKTLHLLEFMQIDDMRGQMERLVNFLSDTEKKTSKETKPASVEPKVAPKQVEEIPHNRYARGVVLPEYRNPNSPIEDGSNAPAGSPSIALDEQPIAFPVTSEKSSSARESLPFERKAASLNDLIQAQPAFVDLKRDISLNDRFLFQRELFGNDRQRMNDTIKILGTFKNYEEAERYAKESFPWDFESSTVRDFLLAVKKGFE